MGKFFHHARKKSLAVFILAGMLLVYCEKRVSIDYADRATIQTPKTTSVSDTGEIRVAIASILSANQTFGLYQELLEYVLSRCSLKAEILYCKDYTEVYRFFESGEVDIGLVCTALYVMGSRKDLFSLLAVPVVNGKRTYYAAIIVPRSSSVRSLEQLGGKPFAFTDRLSLTGYFYPLSKVHQNVTLLEGSMFCGSHDKAIDLVSRGLVDGASVDGLVLEDMLRRTPLLNKAIRIIDKSSEFGIPPVVVAPHISKETADAVRESFCTLIHDGQGAALLQQTGIDRFEEGHDSLYVSAQKLVDNDVSP